MTKQRGFTLVEMLAVIAVGSVLLVLATSVVQRAMKLNSQWRTHADVTRALTRLSHDLRRDAHEANGVTVTQEPGEIQFSLPDGQTVRYTIADDEIVRVLEIPGQQSQREYYKKPVEYQATMTSLSSPERIDLQITRDLKTSGVPPRTVMHVEAQVGRLLRLTQTKEPTP
ncbi:MAG: prepilin-type N-terminal cleavage/methylation domain-containing protein [Bythopirellula sp.]|nr:prepilin-type N-terminal cleavage/methylation domain-containing protein [Bythopirellula sp.]